MVVSWVQLVFLIPDFAVILIRFWNVCFPHSAVKPYVDAICCRNHLLTLFTFFAMRACNKIVSTTCNYCCQLNRQRVTIITGQSKQHLYPLPVQLWLWSQKGHCIFSLTADPSGLPLTVISTIVKPTGHQSGGLEVFEVRIKVFVFGYAWPKAQKKCWAGPFLMSRHPRWCVCACVCACVCLLSFLPCHHK